MVKNVLSRAPDATDLAHRHFCEQMIVDEIELDEATMVGPRRTSADGYQRLSEG